MPEPELSPRDAVFTVTTSVQEIDPEIGNGERTLIIINNTSTLGQKITIAWGKDAVAGSGLVLLPGALWYESMDSEFKPSNLRITAIADGAGATLTLHERVRRRV